MTGWYLVASVVLLLANAFFVAVEFAFIDEPARAARAAGRRGPAQRGRRARARCGTSRCSSPGAQLGITMASLGLGFVAEPAIWPRPRVGARARSTCPTRSTHGIGFGVALLLVTFLHLVIGEMVPKNLAIAGPERTLLALALPNRLFVLVFGPVIRVLNGAVERRRCGCIGLEPKEELASAPQPRGAGRDARPVPPRGDDRGVPGRPAERRARPGRAARCGT